MMFRNVLVIISMVAMVCWSGCSQSGDDSKPRSSSQSKKVSKQVSQPKVNEPPFSFGQASPGDMVRSTDLVDLKDGQVVYEVEYPAVGLASVATLEFPMKQMIKEVFKDRWTVIYTYDDVMHKVSQLPTGIMIYNYVSGGDNQGQLINSYSFDSILRPGIAKYIDRAGKSRSIDVSYFGVMPGGP